MRSVGIILVWCFIMLCEVASARPSLGSALSPALKLKHFSLDVMKFTGNKELMIPEIPGSQWSYRIATNFDMQILRYGFWRNRVHGEAAYAKFYSVGWEYDMGIKLGRQVEIYWHHHSRHTMDIDLPFYYDRMQNRFNQIDYPVEDSVGIRLILIDR